MAGLPVIAARRGLLRCGTRRGGVSRQAGGRTEEGTVSSRDIAVLVPTVPAGACH